jgi:hypothetical protein
MPGNASDRAWPGTNVYQQPFLEKMCCILCSAAPQTCALKTRLKPARERPGPANSWPRCIHVELLHLIHQIVDAMRSFRAVQDLFRYEYVTGLRGNPAVAAVSAPMMPLRWGSNLIVRCAVL